MHITEFLGTCLDAEIGKRAQQKGRKFPYSKAKKLVKEFSPELYHGDLTMDFRNPWDYQTNIKKDNVLHIVHSAIDYLFKLS